MGILNELLIETKQLRQQVLDVPSIQQRLMSLEARVAKLELPWWKKLLNWVWSKI